MVRDGKNCRPSAKLLHRQSPRIRAEETWTCLSCLQQATIASIIFMIEGCKSLKKAGRNDPCPCNSGKKYKQCCLLRGETKESKKTEASINVSQTEQIIQIALDHYRAGNFALAEKMYRQILEIDPKNPDALHLLGLLADQEGNGALAVTLINQAIRNKPSQPFFYNNLGTIYHKQGNLTEAIGCYQKALRLKPDYFQALNNLGNTLKDHGKKKEAAIFFHKALNLKPDYAEAHNNLGIAHASLNKPIEAIPCFQQAITLKPDFAEAYNNLGEVLTGQGDASSAIACFQKALELKPNYAEAHANLANLFKTQGNLTEATNSYNQALALKPEFAMALNNLGITLNDQGRQNEAIDCFRRALKISPDYTDAHTSLILTMDLMADASTQSVQEERKRWHETHAAHLIQFKTYPNAPTPERRLRIGYVSADFKEHSAAYVFGSMLLNFDSSHFDVYAYSNTALKDQLTEKFKQGVSYWREIIGLPDDEVAEMVRKDKIDILIDLSGHSTGNRLLMFARNPAPIQVTAWGYIGGTGLKAMNAFFADQIVVPLDEKPLYAEEVRYLPSAVGHFRPHEFPNVTALPALSNGRVTFGSFNRLVKISDETYRIWARILLAIPNSRMVLKTKELDDANTRVRVMDHFTKEGVNPERIKMLGTTTWYEHLAAFNQIDITLDPFPHGGGVTTLEGLMMGVPVVTLCWPTLVGRLSASILTTLGLTDWIADTKEQYIEIAIKQSQRIEILSDFRHQLRTLISSSIIGDPETYVRAVEREYRTLWQEWCKKNPNGLH